MSIEKICEYLNDIGILQLENINNFLKIYTQISQNKFKNKSDNLILALFSYITLISKNEQHLYDICKNIVNSFTNNQILYRYRGIYMLNNIFKTKLYSRYISFFLKLNSFRNKINLYSKHKSIKSNNKNLIRENYKNEEKILNNNSSSRKKLNNKIGKIINTKSIKIKTNNDNNIYINLNKDNENNNIYKTFDLDKKDDECTFNPKTNKYYKSKQNNNIRSFEKINNENNSSSFLNKNNDNKNNLRRMKGDYYNNSTNYANNNVINNELEKMVENMSKYNGNMSNSRYIPKKLSYRKEFNQMYPSNSYQEIPFYSDPNMNENENYNDLVNNYLNEDYDFYKNEQDYIKKVQEKIFLLKIQKMDKIAEECTFTPEINEVPRYLYRNKNGENNMTDININYENNYKNNIYNINNKFSSNSLNNSKSFSKRRKNKLIEEFTDNNYNVYPKRRKHHSKDSHSYSNSKIKNNEYSVYKDKKDKLMKLFSEQYPFMPSIRENKKFKIKSTFDERQKKFIEDKKKKFKEKEQEELKEIEEMKKYYNKSKTNIQKLVKKLYDDEAEKIKERLKTEKEKSKKKKIIDWDKRNKLNREKYPEEYKINIKSKDRQKHPNLKLENYSSVSKEKETKNNSKKRTNTSKNKKKKKENISNKNDINKNQKLLLEKIKDEHVIGFKNNVPANSNKLNNEIKNYPEINEEKKEDKKIIENNTINTLKDNENINIDNNSQLRNSIDKSAEYHNQPLLEEIDKKKGFDSKALKELMNNLHNK